MKFTLPFIILIVFCNFSLANHFQSKIDSIDYGEDNLPHLIKFQNGHVAFLDGADKSQLSLFEESLEKEKMLEVVVDKSNGLESVQTIDSVEEMERIPYTEVQSPLYEPTVISEYSDALSIFQKMRRDYQNESQCYNRAHVWASEEFKRSGLKSIKLFLFFTNRYIRNYRYHWWFHVSPMVLVNEEGSSVERVMDRRYTAGPHYVKSWTDVFIKSRRACPKVTRYSHYRNNQASQDCYLIPVSMYYWQPRDILRRDQTGYSKVQFLKSEMDWAYKEAF